MLSSELAVEAAQAIVHPIEKIENIIYQRQAIIPDAKVTGITLAGKNGLPKLS